MLPPERYNDALMLPLLRAVRGAARRCLMVHCHAGFIYFRRLPPVYLLRYYAITCLIFRYFAGAFLRCLILSLTAMRYTAYDAATDYAAAIWLMMPLRHAFDFAS